MRGTRLVVLFVVLGALLLLAGALAIWESWPESTSTSGDCARGVTCPPRTVESGSLARTLGGGVLALLGFAALVWAVKVRRDDTSRRAVGRT